MSKKLPEGTAPFSVDFPTIRPGSRGPEGAGPFEEKEHPSALIHLSSHIQLPSPSRRVLILEDEPFCAKTYAHALTQGGFEVDIVDNGEGALQMLLETDYCAVVADLCLPGMSGLELLRCVRVHDLDTIVLLVTAAADFSSATEALRHGASQFLLKPLHSKQLLGEVNRAARLHELAVRRRQAMRLLAADQIEEDTRRNQNLLVSRAIDSLRMVFQPIFTADRRLFGYETLLRSGEPSFKGPIDMIEAAEKLGRLHDLGRACRNRAAREFQRTVGNELLFVNLHALDLIDEELLRPESPLASIASRVVLELTERAPLGESDEIPKRVARLRAMGFRIAIDDLGSGYAGLNSLVQLEPEFVKLDMSLVRGLHLSPIRHRLVSLMIDTCNSLGIQVVAEGVEVQEEYNALVALKCPLFQGYLLGKPGPLPDALAA
jgi:EAL domain-containing protein (putative c-di-GMP-specific phosphodiesterase class I)